MYFEGSEIEISESKLNSDAKTRQAISTMSLIAQYLAFYSFDGDEIFNIGIMLQE